MRYSENFQGLFSCQTQELEEDFAKNDLDRQFGDFNLEAERPLFRLQPKAAARFYEWLGCFPW